MLRLLRRCHDKGIVVELVNGELVEIYITAIKGSQIEVSISNPPDTKVWRGEVYDRILEEKMK